MQKFARRITQANGRVYRRARARKGEWDGGRGEGETRTPQRNVAVSKYLPCMLSYELKREETLQDRWNKGRGQEKEERDGEREGRTGCKEVAGKKNRRNAFSRASGESTEQRYVVYTYAWLRLEEAGSASTSYWTVARAASLFYLETWRDHPWPRVYAPRTMFSLLHYPNSVSYQTYLFVEKNTEKQISLRQIRSLDPDPKCFRMVFASFIYNP